MEQASGQPTLRDNTHSDLKSAVVYLDASDHPASKHGVSAVSA
jgi:hypothetical protein